MHVLACIFVSHTHTYSLYWYTLWDYSFTSLCVVLLLLLSGVLSQFDNTSDLAGHIHKTCAHLMKHIMLVSGTMGSEMACGSDSASREVRSLVSSFFSFFFFFPFALVAMFVTSQDRQKITLHSRNLSNMSRDTNYCKPETNPKVTPEQWKNNSANQRWRKFMAK